MKNLRQPSVFLGVLLSAIILAGSASSSAVQYFLDGTLSNGGAFSGKFSYENSATDLDMADPTIGEFTLLNWDVTISGVPFDGIFGRGNFNNANSGASIKLYNPIEPSERGDLTLTFFKPWNDGLEDGMLFRLVFDLNARGNPNTLLISPRVVTAATFGEGSLDVNRASLPPTFENRQRYNVVSGDISAVPLPPTAMLLSMAVPLLGWVGGRFGRRRGKRT